MAARRTKASMPGEEQPRSMKIAKGDLDVLLTRCTYDRVFFVEHILRVKPDPWQAEVMRELDAGRTRKSIRSGHGVGKTALCSWLALHYLLFRRGVKVVVTSASGKQMDDGLKPEIKIWINTLPRGIGLYEDIEVQNDRILRKSDPHNNFISFRTARLETPEALAGIHAEHVMVIVDEASGVPEPVYEAAQGTLSTAGAIAVLIGNPTRAKGLFWRTHTTLSDHWAPLRVASTDSERVDQAFIDDIRRTYGVDSNQYRVRVQGEFPTSSSDIVIPLDLAQTALDRDIAPIPDDPIFWGLDPGRGGDPTGFVARDSTHIIDIQEWHMADLMRVVGKVKTMWDQTVPSERPSSIYVDSIGMGAGVADRLREMELPVVGVNVAESPALKERYPRLRPEIWFATRDWFEGRDVTINSKLPLAEQLIDELTGPEIIILSNGKADVESKNDLKKRGLPSPNLADALCLTFAYGGAIQAGRGSRMVLPWDRPVRSRYVGVA